MKIALLYIFVGAISFFEIEIVSKERNLKGNWPCGGALEPN